MRPAHHVAVAIIRRGDEIVLVRQGAPGEELFWALPGGVVDEGELVPEGLAREVREESGLEIALPAPLAFVRQIDNRQPIRMVGRQPGTGYLVTVWTFEVGEWSGELGAQDPDGFVKEASFVPVAEAAARLRRTHWLKLAPTTSRAGWSRERSTSSAGTWTAASRARYRDRVRTQATEERLAAARAELAAPWQESEERLVEVGAFPITVRKRGYRYDLDDSGEAVARARALGASSDWLPIAEEIVAEEGFNVNRRGVVFVPAVEGRDLAELAVRLGDTAEAVHATLLETA